MPLRCPRCSRKFKTRQGVVSHLNQPFGPCFGYQENLVSLVDELQAYRRRKEAEAAQHAADGLSTPQQYGNNEMEVDDGPMEFGVEGRDLLDCSVEGFDEGGRAARVVELFDGAAETYGAGTTFMDDFDQDQYAQQRSHNLYYPFASREEWELASFLLRSNLSMASIDKFLSLALIEKLSLSFRTAKELRGRAEILPKGPEWKCKSWTTKIPTKTRVELFYRDALECIQSLLHHPLVMDHLHFTPMRIFETAAKTMRIYTEWMSGDVAWSMQTKLPPGATLLGTILSSDKTNISAMTGGRMAHPLLLSLANLDMDFRMKASNHGFLLLALLPVPKFIYKGRKMRGVLENRLIHECLDFILQPVKTAAQIGTMMSDPLGQLRYVFPALAAYIVDTPESAVLSGVAGKTSSVTMANYKHFGDSFRHEPRTASTTLAQLQALEECVDPWDLEGYSKLALDKFRLCGVHRPFWRDWPLAEPSTFLTPEPLHHWHKMFWDHDAKWCIHAVGSAEIDFRFSILQPHTAYRHFREGISKLKQVTGREHRDVQRYIIPVIAGAVPKGFLIAVRALMDFRYLAQAPEISETVAIRIQSALKEFHDHKNNIIASGARNGKKGAAKDWEIPKLEFLQSVVPNIRDNGVAMQWSADVTERAHITEIKDPSDSTNNQNFEPQICRYLDRADKCRRFDLATAVREARIDFRIVPSGEKGFDSDDEEFLEGSEEHKMCETTGSLLSHIKPINPTTGTARNDANYFQLAIDLQRGLYPRAPKPHRTFLSARSAIHLARDPAFQQMNIEQTTAKFNIPDLRGALIDYLNCVASRRRVANIHSPLPSNFKALEVWTKLRIQNQAYHAPHNVLPTQTINALPPSATWPAGRSDVALINTDPKMIWPSSGIEGHQVAQIRLIFRVVNSDNDSPLKGTDCFLAYIQRFDIVPQINRELSGSSSRKGPYPDPASGMFILKRARRNDQTIMGDVIPLSHIRTLVELVPRFGEKADPRLSKETVLEYSSEFLLDKYFDKEFFYALQQ